MAITRRSFLKGVATTSAASIIGPNLMTSVSAQAAETTELESLLFSLGRIPRPHLRW